MRLHADAVAENRAAAVWAGGIDGDDANRAIFFSVVASQVVDQRALARAGRTGEADDASVAAVWEERLEQAGPSRGMVLNRADGAGQS